MAKGKKTTTLITKNGYDLEFVEEQMDIVNSGTKTVGSYRVVTSSKPVRIIKDRLGTQQEAQAVLDKQQPIVTKKAK
jgi:hypothetical protein